VLTTGRYRPPPAAPTGKKRRAFAEVALARRDHHADDPPVNERELDRGQLAVFSGGAHREWTKGQQGGANRRTTASTRATADAGDGCLFHSAGPIT
jgi:hypothetical protein